MSDETYVTECAECPICTSPYCSHPGCEDALKQRARIAELEAILVRAANWLHHGNLLPESEVNELRHLTIKYWDRSACAALQEGEG
jgi:hypothetical protein